MIDRSLSHYLGKRRDFQVEEMTFFRVFVLFCSGFFSLFVCLFCFQESLKCKFERQLVVSWIG